MTKNQVSIFVCLLFFGHSFGQLPVPRNIQKAYDKKTRSTDGKPGKQYWQNSADYVFDINFNPFTRVLNGTVNIHYANNSPDTLSEIWFKLYPNLYKKGAPRTQSISAADISDGVQISSVVIDGIAKDVSQLAINATNMTVNIDPLLPAKQIDITISYSYVLNQGSHNRTGEIEPNADFVAYFFPRVAVYDDIDGWNRYPYTGTQEFYNDFCDFRANITVPKNFIVWATGNLMNCNEVLNPIYCDRLQHAEISDDVTTIVDTNDLQTKAVTIDEDHNTWRFEANNVTDFVFATSDHYIWKSSSLIVDKSTRRRTRVDAAFNPIHKDYFDVINHARSTVEHMSYDFPKWPYPYPHETVFDGLDQMEYPMMVNDNPLADHESEIELTDHEIFHTMFPFYMGVNETKYAWMDEGWATIGEWLISPTIDSTIVDEYGVHSYELSAGDEIDLPIKTLSSEINGTTYFLNSYPKPAFGYLFVKDLLGDELFTKALHFYIEQWHGKHPMPYDFFNSMNAGSGRNLDWFWKRWFFDDGVPDLSITTVHRSGNKYEVVITSKGNKPVPVDLTIFYGDGASQKIHRTIAVWEKSSMTSVSFTTNKPLQKLVLGSAHVPDINKADNEYIFR